MSEKIFSVYAMTNQSNSVLYIGVTNNLIRRVFEHKQKIIQGFTLKYNCVKLVYFETTDNAMSAIKREKEIKGWVRRKKNILIESINPVWKDLANDFL